MDNILAILTKEDTYANRLADFINKNKSFTITAVAFSALNSLKEFSKNHLISLLICDEESLPKAGFSFLKNTVNKDKSTKVMVLKDNLSSAPNLLRESAPDNSYSYIAKYQDGAAILKELIVESGNLGITRKWNENMNARIIGIYSPSSSFEKDIFSLVLSKYLSSKKRLLYLPLKEFSVLTDEYESTKGHNLSEALYLMKQASLNEANCYSLISNFKGIDYIAPINVAEDFNAIKASDYISLINEIISHCAYEILIVDMDKYGGEAEEIMDICDDIYMPIMDNFLEPKRAELFKNALREENKDALLEKICELRIPENSIPITNDFDFDKFLYSPIGDTVRKLESI